MEKVVVATDTYKDEDSKPSPPANSTHQPMLDINHQKLTGSAAASIRNVLDTSPNLFSPCANFKFPSDARFDNVTARWTIYEQPTFCASVSVCNEEDIQAAVSSNGRFFRPRRPPDPTLTRGKRSDSQHPSTFHFWPQAEVMATALPSDHSNEVYRST